MPKGIKPTRTAAWVAWRSLLGVAGQFKLKAHVARADPRRADEAQHFATLALLYAAMANGARIDLEEERAVEAAKSAAEAAAIPQPPPPPPAPTARLARRAGPVSYPERRAAIQARKREVTALLAA